MFRSDAAGLPTSMLYGVMRRQASQQAECSVRRDDCRAGHQGSRIWTRGFTSGVCEHSTSYAWILDPASQLPRPRTRSPRGMAPRQHATRSSGRLSQGRRAAGRKTVGPGRGSIASQSIGSPRLVVSVPRRSAMKRRATRCSGMQASRPLCPAASCRGLMPCDPCGCFERFLACCVGPWSRYTSIGSPRSESPASYQARRRSSSHVAALPCPRLAVGKPDWGLTGWRARPRVPDGRGIGILRHSR